MANHMFGTMNEDQRDMYNSILNAVQIGHRETSCYYLDDKAGCGNLFVAQAICCKLRSEQKVPIIVGITASSVYTYERGRAGHSTFGISITDNSDYFEFNINIHAKHG